MNTHQKNKETNLRRPDLQQNCTANLTFRLDLPKKIPTKSRDTWERIQKKNFQKEFPLFFHLNFIHNHQIKRHEYSRFGIVSEETKNRFIQYFESGMTASAAWHANRDEITKNNPDHFHIVLGNGRVSPDYRWPYRFQQHWAIIHDELHRLFITEDLDGLGDLVDGEHHMSLSLLAYFLGSSLYCPC